MVKYFKVVAKCGHVGKMNCVYIDFAVKANSKKEAASKTREYKRVKHQHKDAILSVDEITYDEFVELKLKNDNDPYLHCKNVQEQREILDFKIRVCPDIYNINRNICQFKKEDCKEYKRKKEQYIILNDEIEIKEYLRWNVL